MISTMSDWEGTGRPKRRSARSKQTAAPSAVHYVGYVEEDETPEAIMKKFEELEKVCCAQTRLTRSSSSVNHLHYAACNR